jgi:hypothetical protein
MTNNQPQGRAALRSKYKVFCTWFNANRFLCSSLKLNCNHPVDSEIITPSPKPQQAEQATAEAHSPLQHSSCMCLPGKLHCLTQPLEYVTCKHLLDLSAPSVAQAHSCVCAHCAQPRQHRSPATMCMAGIAVQHVPGVSSCDLCHGCSRCRRCVTQDLTHDTHIVCSRCRRCSATCAQPATLCRVAMQAQQRRVLCIHRCTRSCTGCNRPAHSQCSFTVQCTAAAGAAPPNICTCVHPFNSSCVTQQHMQCTLTTLPRPRCS